MKFNYSKENLTKNEQRLQRIFEVIPGCLSWGILLLLVIISIIKPLLAIIIIIAFDFYWLLRLIYMTIFLVLSFCRLSMETKTDWMSRVRGIDNLDQYMKELNKLPKFNFNNGLSNAIHKKELLALSRSDSPPPSHSEVYHLVILPVAKESIEILKPSIESLCNQTFPLKQIFVVIALEERASEIIKKDILSLEREYEKKFMDFKIIIHPSNLENEAKVKGANVTWAAKKAAEYFKLENIPYKNITVSCFDSDTIVGVDYFACLTYSFMVTPFRLQASFQPIPVYNNNIWDVPGFARVMETGSSFFQLIESTNTEQLVTFSSHSMSFKALVDVGYWPVDMISDDSAIFWKSFIHYDGKFSVVPMYTKVSMDITVSSNLFKTIISIYKQKQRWAWGVENFPIVFRAFLKLNKLSFFKRIRYIFKLLEGHLSWATWGFILTILSWLPTLFVKNEFADTVVYYNAPYISGIIFNLASISLIISIILSLLLLPKIKIRFSILKKFLFALQWLMMPLILVFLSAIPALDAQTRMLLGKRMEFWVAEKRKI